MGAEASDFVQYFKKQWVEGALCNWFEGVSIYPSTNNGLECCNMELKKTHTLRRRLSFDKFVLKAVDVVRHWTVTKKVR